MRIAAVITALVVLAGCVPEAGRAPLAPLATGGPAGTCTGAPQFEAPPLNTCSGPRARLAFVGDVLLHVQMQDHGYKVGFGNIWHQPARYLRTADVAVANLEGAVAPGVAQDGTIGPDPGPGVDIRVYTGFPQFNYHPVVLRDLAAAGVDLVTTANNHAMDRGSVGADMTLAEVAKAGLAAVGTVPAGAPRDFVHRRATPAGTIAFIACSFSTNGLPDPKRQLLRCFRDEAQLTALVRREAADPGVAGVIVLPHWGVEYRTSPSANQRALARALVAAGATAVVGTHPHAVQPFEVLTSPGGGGAPVVYSTGNFVAIQDFMPSKVGAMALIDLCRGADGRAVAERAGWIAMEMLFTDRGYWAEIAPKGAEGRTGRAEAFLKRVAPGFSAQPPACTR
ncbi:CapA family protein [Sinisalibacter lacisalsi]|uniref:Capsule synthesis protein CapA domain-containing protein n=1 Tax=Sinisalibacter lacisalsi TaxID=1526570 RepID=A0ABQ1QTF3_9RHOB|nr:CapA family protein [Sinisalibacter lacisalsi]GGD44050.1 hypothetical protein GCM10011358_29760 [Sinisalibacter lacisalsi]